MARSKSNTVESYQRLAYFQILVTSRHEDFYGEDPENEDDERLFELGQEVRNVLFSEFQRQVRRTLGEEYRIEEYALDRGSLIISFAIAGAAFFKSPAGELLLDFARYEALVKSLTLLSSQITGLVKRILRNPKFPTTATTSWQPAPMLSATMNASLAPTQPQMELNGLLLGYLVLSHAALLGFVLWVVVRHLK